LKNYATYTLKTLLTAFLLCITLQLVFSQSNSVDAKLVSDSTKVSPNSFQTVNTSFEKMKIPLLKRENEKRLWLLPALAWNNYDKTQLGVIIGLEKKNKYSFLAIPMYGLGSRNLTGLIHGKYQFTSPKIKLWELNLNAKRFSYLLFPEDLTYNRIQGKIRFVPELSIQGKLDFSITSHYIWQEYILNGRQTQAFNIHELGASYANEKETYSFKTNLTAEFNNTYGQINWTNNLKFHYLQQAENALYIRSFVGGFLYNTRANSLIDPPLPIFQLGGMSNSGIYWLQKDYTFNDFYLDRNAQDNFLQRQVANSAGGFKSVMSIGNSKLVMASLNVRSDLLIPLRIKRWINLQAFVNAAISLNKGLKASLFAEGGISLLFLDECIGFHAPFATTSNIQLNQQTAYGIERSEWTKRITFSIDFIKLKNKISE
tara:strand:- start:5821 stop:7107 length:1287 start_codon:yes stop_codon:yes gene_type:complete